jgi:hypothetical protein
MLKSDEEKSKYASLTRENGFAPADVLSLLRLVKCAAKLLHLLEKSVINMIRLLNPVFDWPRSRWFTISSSHIFAVPLSVLLVGLPKT